MPGDYDESTSTRVFNLSHALKYTLQCRQRAQVIIAHAFVQILSDEDFVSTLAAPSEFKALLLDLEADIKKPSFQPEIFGTPSPAATMLCAVLPSLGFGYNTTAQALFIKRYHHGASDMGLIGSVLSAVNLKHHGESPKGRFARFHSPSHGFLREPYPRVN